MNCPICGNACRNGFVEAKNAGSLTQSLTMVSWFPEENKGKLLRRGAVDLHLQAEACYCEECMKVFAVFEEK